MSKQYVSVGKQLTQLLLDSKMDQYVGLPAKQLSEELCEYLDKRRLQKQLENSTRQSWHWGDTNG